MNNRFVEDGHRRARRDIEQEIRAKLEARHAEALQHAGFWQRLRIRRRINKEVAREVQHRATKQAPPEALY